ncbi:hypothetical protein K1719_014919 [Acacia pycnantha]|nr:hypothetical protein K1719_014919 [Acacia pycnantha]
MASKSQFSKGSSTVRKITQLNNDHDAESENGNSGNLATYTVHLPPTPDNQPVKITMERSSSQRVEDQYASSSIFTGGFNHKPGLIYNEFFSVPFELFGPSAYGCCDPSCRDSGTTGLITVRRNYPFGLDPMARISKRKERVMIGTLNTEIGSMKEEKSAELESARLTKGALVQSESLVASLHNSVLQS